MVLIPPCESVAQLGRRGCAPPPPLSFAVACARHRPFVAFLLSVWLLNALLVDVTGAARCSSLAQCFPFPSVRLLPLLRQLCGHPSSCVCVCVVGVHVDDALDPSNRAKTKSMQVDAPVLPLSVSLSLLSPVLFTFASMSDFLFPFLASFFLRRAASPPPPPTAKRIR